MISPIDREMFVIKNNGRLITIEVFKMEDLSFKAFAIKNFDRENEIVGEGDADDKETAIKLAIQDLIVEMKK